MLVSRASEGKATDSRDVVNFAWCSRFFSVFFCRSFSQARLPFRFYSGPSAIPFLPLSLNREKSDHAVCKPQMTNTNANGAQISAATPPRSLKVKATLWKKFLNSSHAASNSSDFVPRIMRPGECEIFFSSRFVLARPQNAVVNVQQRPNCFP